ncbi:MAG: hypothetical protein O2960_29145, partial [Verrucomicrobia bacterium]|nr:hypothetical protein [Verrucomicrobiota bacterium]
ARREPRPPSSPSQFALPIRPPGISLFTAFRVRAIQVGPSGPIESVSLAVKAHSEITYRKQ